MSFTVEALKFYHLQIKIFWLLPFLFVPLYISPAIVLRPILNKTGGDEHRCCVSDTLPLSEMLAKDLLCVALLGSS